MEWVKVTTESVRSHMAVELIEAYDKWIVAYPEKAGRLDEIVSNVRTEFRDAIKSVPRNRLNEDPETLPVSAVRHCENICMYEMAMEVGVHITQDGRTLLTNAQIYLRQIPYGRYRFYEDEEDTGVPLPSCNFPERSSGRALGNLVAVLLCVFSWCLSARAAWIKPGDETTYVPVNYDITEQSLNGHLAGIDAAMGWLSDTNSLYGRLVGLPQLVYDLIDAVETGSLYGEFREDANAWIVRNQTNLYLQGSISATRVIVGNIFGEDGLTVHGNAEIDGGLDVGGDVSLSAGLILGGVRRDSWPEAAPTNFLPIHWQTNADYDIEWPLPYAVVPGKTYFNDDVKFGGHLYVSGAIYTDDMIPSQIHWLQSERIGIGSQDIGSWGELTNDLNARVVELEAADVTMQGIIDNLEAEIDNLEAEWPGPAWLTPARFEWEAERQLVKTETVGPVVSNSNNSVWFRDTVMETKEEWRLEPVIQRNAYSETLAVEVDGNAVVAENADGSYTLEWLQAGSTNDTADVTGTLGSWVENVTVQRGTAGVAVTQTWFYCFAPGGGFREALNGVFLRWEETPGNKHRFLNYSVGRTSTVETLALVPNPDFWAQDCDLSGVSVWNDLGGYYYTKPVTLIAADLSISAAHWSPPVGTTVAFYGRDGLAFSRVVAQQKCGYDLAFSRLSPPLDTNAVTAYPILDAYGAWNATKLPSFASGKLQGVPKMPFLACAQAGTAWLMGNSTFDAVNPFGPSITFALGPMMSTADPTAICNHSRQKAVGGDSGHPAFVTPDGTNLILVGCAYTETSISYPGSAKSIAEGAANTLCGTNVIRWDALTNWPWYSGIPN